VLFNYFTAHFPEVSELKASLADDFKVGASDPDLEVIAAALNRDLVKISQWAKRKCLRISAEKLQVIFFTPWNREKDFPKFCRRPHPFQLPRRLRF
jgi:hypothetical protein